jgi:protein-S-isoprenylcysteine O-methyltransferase Ste14
MREPIDTYDSPHLDSMGKKGLVKYTASFVVTTVLLFVCAGRLDWPIAWAYTGVRLVFYAWAIIWGVLKDPDLINERSRRAPDMKNWDKIILVLFLLSAFGITIVGGLDAGRYGWSSVPFALQLIGLTAFAGALVIPNWAMMANHYHSAVVRIQHDRGHKVVSGGPYAYLRHPTYAGLIVSAIAGPISLGSLWALIPGIMMAIVFVVRTALEDATLKNELEGYSDYAGRVRYRLLPGVW